MDSLRQLDLDRHEGVGIIRICMSFSCDVVSKEIHLPARWFLRRSTVHMRNALGHGARTSLKYPASITGRYFVNRAWKHASLCV